MKRCPRCGETKPITAYHPWRGKLRAYCPPCSTAYGREWERGERYRLPAEPIRPYVLAESLSVLARRSGVSLSTLERVRRGQAKITLDTADRLAMALGQDISSLWGPV